MVKILGMYLMFTVISIISVFLIIKTTLLIIEVEIDEDLINEFISKYCIVLVVVFLIGALLIYKGE